MAPNHDYADLKQLVKAAGLLERQPWKHYGRRTLALALLLIVSVTLMAVADSLYLHLLNAGLLAFTTVQLCFLGHDLGHHQVFKKRRHNDVAGLLVSALVGINRSWWVDKHNQHHSNPNHVDLDPDINLPVIAFTEEAARSKPKWAKAIVRRQAALFYPLTCLEAVVLKASGVQRLLSTGKPAHLKLRFPIAERTAMIAHATAYLGLAFTLIAPLEAALFAIVHHALTGLYISATFAPNHKGMQTVDASSTLDYLRRQTLTSRNVRPSRINDYLHGGLNYQIEHHLFPTMPRNQLGKAREIIKPFCQQRGVSYHETGPLQSQREIIQHLQSVSNSLRQQPATAAA